MYPPIAMPTARVRLLESDIRLDRLALSSGCTRFMPRFWIIGVPIFIRDDLIKNDKATNIIPWGKAIDIKKGIDNSYYHSFILDDENNVIDFTANLIMPKEQYYLLQEVNELNCISYKEYLEEKDNSIKFDESKTLYNILRNAVYKQYLEENKV